jgi:ribosomal protein S18 acetylase RimI-like enzyme
MTSPTVRPLSNADRAWVRQFMIAHWGDEIIVGHGEVMRPHEHAGFGVFDGDTVIGLVTYRIVGDECEVISLDSLREGLGIGKMLMQVVVDQAKLRNCTRVWLITTNDNIRALAFYQKRGFVIAAVHRNAVDTSRKLKPSIPLIANNGIPIRDEIELEMMLR